MPRPEVSRPWYASPYTGLFRRSGPVPLRPHDPAVCAWAGTLPRWGPDGSDLAAGGAGWDEAAAEAAGVGEAVERWLCRPLPQDEILEASYAAWPLDEPAVEPERWVLFHAGQYAVAGFPFRPLTRDAVCRWVCCREAGSGVPRWVPEGLVFLQPRPGAAWEFGPSISTGLACGRAAEVVLLRGLQEVIERDALVGAWWERYLLVEYPTDEVFHVLPARLPARLLRRNLRYRCYRVATPYSAHVTVVTLEGEDREGYCFSVGSACRETRAASWEKAFLEAVQGRHYIRLLKASGAGLGGPPVDFAGHAVWYSYHPEELAGTVLHRAGAPLPEGDEGTSEGFPALAARLGPAHPVLFRNLTPPALAAEGLGCVVLRVLVPGLQPLHGHHGYPFLGGPLWGGRPVEEWGRMPPHPFP
jgi:ribosomal protein S12 methylthiotransferase accessory factor